MASSPFKAVAKTIVTNTSQYAAGDFIGSAILTLADVPTVNGGAYLTSLSITDLTKQNAVIDFLFFSSVCSNTTFTNNGALDVHDTDLLTFLGHVNIAAANYVSLADSSVGTVAQIGLALQCNPASTSLYVVPVLTSGTPTWDASALQVTFNFLRS